MFGCTGSVTDDGKPFLIQYAGAGNLTSFVQPSVLVDALLMGFKDGQDILSLSLGGADGWTESSSAVVASRLSALGKVITIAAGNDVSSNLLIWHRCS